MEDDNVRIYYYFLRKLGKHKKYFKLVNISYFAHFAADNSSTMSNISIAAIVLCIPIALLSRSRFTLMMAAGLLMWMHDVG